MQIVSRILIMLMLMIGFAAAKEVGTVDPNSISPDCTITPEGKLEMGPPSIVPSPSVLELQRKIRERELELQRYNFKQYEA